MTVRLSGLCNRCGLCCFDGELRCQNLIVIGKPGEPLATACSRHGSRYNGMPITMFDPEGRSYDGYFCHNDDLETAVIIERGIGKGCSLEVVRDE